MPEDNHPRNEQGFRIRPPDLPEAIARRLERLVRGLIGIEKARKKKERQQQHPLTIQKETRP